MSANRTATRIADQDDATLVDPGADRIVFWDDSAGKFTHLTPGSGLAIVGTVLTATGGSGTDLGWINVKDFGATGDGVTDDTDAIAAAYSVVSASGNGVLYFPKGIYNFTHLDFSGCIALTIRGVQGYQWWGPDTTSPGRTVLHCTATDALDGINCFQAEGLILQDIEFSYVNGYTGILLQIGGSAGRGSNTVLVKQCHFVSDESGSYMTALAFIGLNDTVCVVIQDCSLMGAASLIKGMERVVGGFATDVIISRCSFERCTIGRIVNPAQCWRIEMCTFECTDDSIVPSITSDETSIPLGSFTFIDVVSCYFWDGGIKAIVQPAGVRWDLRVRDCWFGLFADKLVELNGPGSFIFEGNSYEGFNPTTASTIIDLGDPATALKNLVYIVGNLWDSGDQSNAIINYAGHNSVFIGNNSNTGPWATVHKINGTPYDNSTDIVIGGIPPNSKSADYTLVLSDAGKHIFHPAADVTARTWTIDQNVTVPYPAGTTITFVNEHGAGIITIAITADTLRQAVTGTTGSRTLAADGIATALKITSTSWLISGSGLT